MSPAHQDLLINGAFLYEGSQSNFISMDYKLGDYGMKVLGRVPLTDPRVAPLLNLTATKVPA